VLADGSTPVTAEGFVHAVLARELEVDPARIADDASLVDDLELDSLALIELRQVIEDRLSTTVDEVRAGDVRTVADLVALVAELQTGAEPAAGSRS
jgi:acyl carrier protein